MHRSALLLIAAFLPGAAMDFTISFPAERSAQALDGRLLLLLSTDPSAEPRFQINDAPIRSSSSASTSRTGSRAGGRRRMERPSATPFGLSQFKPGEYTVQALLNRYETFHLADGRVAQAPARPRRGPAMEPRARQPVQPAAQDPHRPRRARSHIASRSTRRSRRSPRPRTPSTSGTIRIHSERLTKFWGTDMYLGANVLLPEGFDAHPEAHYPLIVYHGHFPADFDGFRTEPPDPNLKPDYSERFHLDGYNRIVQQEAYEFYKKWTGPELPAHADRRNPARQSVLRRLLRREFGQRRPLRRRHHVRADP